MTSNKTDKEKDIVVLGVDGKPINKRFKANMFEEEVVLTEKQRQRRDLVENRDKMKEVIKNMTPMELFVLFDEDDSGLISFREFQNMLPFLDISISDAKAYRYFKLCDTDGSGEIDIDEFQVALFACDPNSGNPVGFKPSKNLTPIDAFEIFDEDQSGFLDEDEYRYAIEYLQINAPDEIVEDLFLKFDLNNTGTIDYEEFREIFLRVCDLRKELEDRDIDVPTFIRKKTLRNLFREVLIEEEIRERKALAEAKRYKKWVLNIRDSKRLLKKAQFRAYQELKSALDAAGHVYVIGGGSYSQFNQHPSEILQTKRFKFENFEKVIELWKDRVQPEQLIDRLGALRRAEEQDETRDAERNLTGLGALTKMLNEANKIEIDPYKQALESPFIGMNVAVNTAALWGRRIHQVAISESVIFALSDTGEIYTLGGNSHWWHEIQPESQYQTKWRGDVTPRSQILMGTADKQLPPDVSLDVNTEGMSPEEKIAEAIKVVAKYYNQWEPPPNPATKMRYLQKDIMSKLGYEELKFSLKVRGKIAGDMTKMQLVDDLYADITLEKRLLGERTHKAIREIEMQVASLLKRKKTKLAEKFLARIDEMWLPLREVQAEHRAAEIKKDLLALHGKDIKLAESYQEWRQRVVEKRENMNPTFTPRGNGLKIDLIGVTPRGPDHATPRGYQAAISISAGSAHAAVIHKSGQLYTWGVGSAGRLGLDLTEQGEPQSDAKKPTLVQSLAESVVVKVSCGYSHTGAIISGGELYMWGSTVTGKCGLGKIVASEECYCSIPTRIIIGPEDRKVKKLSCGSAHSAVITEAGQLYVFGCGDGGRLGMGQQTYPTLFVPTLVHTLLSEKIATVSCGNTTTIVSTDITHEWVGDLDDKYRQLTGGRVYVAGSVNVLGKQCDEFTLIKDIIDKPIKQVSAGFLHTALVSAEGELLCWGNNKGGCCGVSPTKTFLEVPTISQFMYTSPLNIARGKRAYQSSTYNRREALYAVNGNMDGNGVNKSTCTQQESQSWIEIDLGKMAMIDKVVVWNRTDVPSDRTQPRDLYTSRLFPCWVMIGRDPFQKTPSAISLRENLRNAVCKVKFTEDKRVSTWRCPVNAQGRYVRLQIEQFNMLSVAEIEVYGHWGINKGVGRVSYAVAGRDVTVVVVRPNTDPKDVELCYKRAAYSDALNADILRQLETYTLEYDKYGRGEVLGNPCNICNGTQKCESCILYETYSNDINKMPPVIGGRRRRLNSISEFLTNSNKPELEPIIIQKSIRPTKWDLIKKKYLGDFDLTSFFIPRAQKNYITPEEALAAKPDELMDKIRFSKKSEIINNKKLKNEKNTLISIDSSTDIMNSSSQNDDNNSNSIINLSQDGLIDEKITSSIQIIKEKKEIKVGDVLATGHVVKPAFPKSIAKQIETTNEIMQERAEREQQKLKKEKKKKEQKFALGK
eukprot:gene10397-13965_t